MRILLVTFLLSSFSWSSRADENVEAGAQIIPSSSLDEEAPKASDEKVEFSIPASKSGSKSKSKASPKRLGTVTLRQISSKVRVEFEGTALRRGHYVLFSIDGCAGSQAGKTTSVAVLNKKGRELHSFETESGEIYTEKSLPEASLHPDARNSLHHRSIVLARKTKSSLEVIACGQLQ